MAHYVKCKNCKVNFDALENCAGNIVCPLCGTLQDLMINVSDDIVIREMLKKKDKIAGLGKPISEQMAGDDFSHERQKWCHKERIIDRGNNRYMEIVIDTETGELIHYCEEPLNQHFGHGSAKIGGQT